MSPGPFLFDLDGTLADTLPDIAASVDFVRAQHDLPPCRPGAVRGFVGDGARLLLHRALAEVLPADPAAAAAQLDAAFASYRTHHRDQCTRHARAFPGVAEHLRELRRRGHALAVVTNKPVEFARPILAHLGLAELLPVVVGGDSLPQRKPDPAPLRHALAELGHPAGAGATMVGDSVQDLRAGKAAGLATIGCLYGYGEPAALRAEGATGWWSAFGIAAPAGP